MNYKDKNQTISLFLYRTNLEMQPSDSNITIEHAMEITKDIASRKGYDAAKLQHDELVKQRRLLEDQIDNLHIIMSCHNILADNIILKEHDDIPF